MNVESNLNTAQQLGLNVDEFNKIVEIMGRTPNFTELSIYSVMWSEHCSYKNSIKYLKTLPRSGKNLLVEAGSENAGLVDIGDGLACAFKIESHNHPSAIEPYQGAATGVGGIHRDIFTMGARPIAALNSLRFGDLTLSHTKKLVKGVVKGIGDYGNCLGVPTIGGETFFHKSYNQNILVNAMSVGIVEKDKTVSAIAEGIGNKVFIAGAQTGKDGIHGATFASADLSENSAEDLPSVQVGDPFYEKLLLEASLEAIDQNIIIGMQDMGAAGIICSCSEMSAKGKVGMNIHLDLVPCRQKKMKDWELLLSESQERMLIICSTENAHQLVSIFDKWDLPCVEIGEVIEGENLNFYFNGSLCAQVNADSLVLGGGAPVYSRTFKTPEYFDKISQYRIESIPESNINECISLAQQLTSSPNLASKAWIFEQYDSMVRTNTLQTNKACDASVIRIKNTNKALVLTVDCNASYVFANPYIGTKIAVFEAARNIVCAGGKPMAITNCLNFGNPYQAEVYFQFVEAIKGMGEACIALETPVTGGNVSFYNQSEINGVTEPIYPTPTIGMLGLMEDISTFTSLSFQDFEQHIIVLGEFLNDISSSEYVRTIHQVEYSPVPQFDEKKELDVQRATTKLIEQHLISSAHDISEGGLFQNLLESASENKIGFDIVLPDNIRLDAALFGESQSRIVISSSKQNLDKVMLLLNNDGVPYFHLGKTIKEKIIINKVNFGLLTSYIQIHNQTISNYF